MNKGNRCVIHLHFTTGAKYISHLRRTNHKISCELFLLFCNIVDVKLSLLFSIVLNLLGNTLRIWSSVKTCCQCWFEVLTPSVRFFRISRYLCSSCIGKYFLFIIWSIKWPNSWEVGHFFLFVYICLSEFTSEFIFFTFHYPPFCLHPGTCCHC